MSKDKNYQDEEYFQEICQKLYGDLVLLNSFLAEELDNTDNFLIRIENLTLMEWSRPFMEAYKEVYMQGKLS